MESFLDIMQSIVFVALLFGGYHFYRAYKKSKLLLPEEVGAVAIYTEQAGGQFGNAHWTIPFVRVSCYSHFVAIHCWNAAFVLKTGDVQHIKKEGLVSDGITIFHHRYDLPENFIIWPRNIAKLMEAIETSLRLPNTAAGQAKTMGRAFPFDATQARVSPSTREIRTARTARK